MKSLARILIFIFCAALPIQGCNGSETPPAKFASPWPPISGSRYPDLTMKTLSGEQINLSRYAGKIILIEPIGMSCPACQAFVGANERGGINGVAPQAGLPSIDSLLSSNGITPDDERLVRVQLLLYGPDLKAPQLDEARKWAKHFDFGKSANEVVLVADNRYQNDASYNMIPGFQLVDENFVLRSDACGHAPHNDLYRHLLPMLKSMLQK